MALQEPVQAAIDALVTAGAETVLQVAVLHEGQVAADAVAGIADDRTGAPVEAAPCSLPHRRARVSPPR